MTATNTDTPKDRNPLPSRGNGHEAATPTPALPFDVETLSELSDSVLAALAAEAPVEIARRQAKREADLVNYFREQALAIGTTPERLAAAIAGKQAARVRANGAGDGRSRVAPKYRDFADPTGKRAWSGRGQAPAWIEFGDEIDPKTGKKLPLAKFRIPDPGAE